MKGKAKKVRDKVALSMVESFIRFIYYLLVVILAPVSFVAWVFNSMSLSTSIKFIPMVFLIMFGIEPDLLRGTCVEDLNEEI